MDFRYNFTNVEWISPILGLFAIVAFVVHLIFSFAIFIDAKNLSQNGNSTKFVTPVIWFITILATSIAGATLYWVIHHSSFSKGTELDSDCLFGSNDENEPVDKWERSNVDSAGPRPPES